MAKEAKTNGQIAVKMKLEKETANSIRYQEVGDDGAVVERAFAKIGTQYVPKTTFGQGVKPTDIIVTISW